MSFQALAGRAAIRLYLLLVLLCFAHANNRFQGRIVLKQVGTQLTGVWRTDVGKDEPDDRISGQVAGDTVYFTRFIAGGDLKQKYALTMRKDGNQLFGYGDGFGLNHTDLNMWREAEKPKVSSKPKKFGSSNLPVGSK